MTLKSPINLLVVDDEPAIRHTLRHSLQAIGYASEEAASGEGALMALTRHSFEMVLLDINMPGIGGVEACRRIRDCAPETGIIMITVREAEDDKVRCLEAGADDYITKPFRFRELIARLRAVRRRMRGPTQTGILRAGELELDIANRLFRKGGREIHLSRREFDILAFLMSHAGAPVAHGRLLKAVWGQEYGNETEYLRTYIRMLRRKIELDPSRPAYLLTEPWIGYRLNDPVVAEAVA